MSQLPWDSESVFLHPDLSVCCWDMSTGRFIFFFLLFLVGAGAVDIGLQKGSLRAVRLYLPYLPFQVSSTLGNLLTVVFHLQENLSFFFGPLHFKIQFGLLLDSNHLPQKFKVSTLTLQAICCLLPTGGFILLFVPLDDKMQLHPF